MYDDRPKIKIPLSKWDRKLEWTGIVLLVMLWLFILYIFFTLPDVIPTHFNWKGKADGTGSKWTLLILPVLASVVYAGLTFINRYPHLFNYINKITQQNAFYQYSLAIRMMRYIKLGILVFIILIVLLIYCSALGIASNINAFVVPVMSISLILPIVITGVLSGKKKSGIK